jgi:predicted nucleic acid-binding protein
LNLVIDASVAIAWIASDERSAYAERALAACGTDRAVVPMLWYWEIANALLALERRGRLADASAAYASVLRNLPIDAANHAREARLEEIAYARKHRLNVCDAAYLALAKSSGYALATLDEPLASAAVAESALFS